MQDNPLCPALQQAAGKCITPGDCALAAKKVVALLQSYESQLQRERQRRLQEEAAAQAEAELREERERERVRLEKRAMKEKRREEARLREAEQRREAEEARKCEMQLNGGCGAGQAGRNGSVGGGLLGGAASQTATTRPAPSCFASLLLLLAGLAVLGAGLAVSLLWIYTEGRLDSRSVSTALPVIQADVEEALLSLGQRTARLYEQSQQAAGPALER